MAEKWCPLKDAINWMSRATGIGYHPPPPLAPQVEYAQAVQQKTDELVIQVEQLERELRRRGELPAHQ